MIDAAIGETPAESVPPVPPPPEATAELDGAPPQAEAPAAEESATGEAETEAIESFDPRTSIPESLGPVRRAILEGLIDTEGPMSVSQLHAVMPPGTPRSTAEASILREFRSGRIERVSPGHYTLAPARPPEAKPAPPPEPVRADGTTDEVWLAWLGEWRAGGKWEGPGNPPNQSGCLVPLGVIAKHNDRVRKREERRREAEAAAAKRTAADVELRDRLIGATGGNVVRGPGLDDVAPIKLALQVVPIDRILSSIRYKTDRKLYPKNEPASSWGERRLLKAIAEDYCGSVIVPRLVAAWEAAGKSPAPKTQSSPAAAQMPDDIDELRRLHDSPSAPPGPHIAADAATDMLHEAAGASEAPGATPEAPEAENASTAPPANGSVPSDDNPGEPDSMPAALTAAMPAEPTRSSILAAFNRNRTPPQPAAPQPTGMSHQELGLRAHPLVEQHPCGVAEGRRAALHHEAAVDLAIEQLAAGGIRLPAVNVERGRDDEDDGCGFPRNRGKGVGGDHASLDLRRHVAGGVVVKAPG
jgi:hypothetical protein